ncbi:hypothetical protein E2C01_032413 [Portunus trituberculatus]|uniref:Uncharacterized protein n=1 Tax=Portunus trituberculatus TaxID=210409 RepID=A0A5B7F0N9_PORTR|nr:hypothetical protein [Portunus trituberculatus]
MSGVWGPGAQCTPLVATSCHTPSQTRPPAPPPHVTHQHDPERHCYCPSYLCPAGFDHKCPTANTSPDSAHQKASTLTY